MEDFTLLPIDGDLWGNPKAYDYCGWLFPIHTKTKAVKYAKSVKKQFPTITFRLFKGKVANQLVFIQDF